MNREIVKAMAEKVPRIVITTLICVQRGWRGVEKAISVPGASAA
jgi:hypothetical protein